MLIILTQVLNLRWVKDLINWLIIAALFTYLSFLLSSAPSHQISFDDMLTVYVLYTEKVDFCLHFFLTFLKRLSASKFLNHDQKIIFFAFIFNVCLGSFFSGHLHRVIALLPVYHIAIKRLKRIKLNPTSGVCLQVHVKMSC